MSEPVITKKECEEILARAHSATPGPWGPHEMPKLSEHHRWYEVGPYPDAPVAEVSDHYENMQANAEFIGHAREDVPTLVRNYMRAMELHIKFHSPDETGCCELEECELAAAIRAYNGERS